MDEEMCYGGYNIRRSRITNVDCTIGDCFGFLQENVKFPVHGVSFRLESVSMLCIGHNHTNTNIKTNYKYKYNNTHKWHNLL